MTEQQVGDFVDDEAVALNIEAAQRKGRGLNSIPVRFALMTAIVCWLCFAIQYWLILPTERLPLSVSQMGAISLTLFLPAAVTFLAARKLAGMISALRQSTLAILDGDINSPVDVDCACEVGGLADGFRAMVARLNGNILRMNILAYTDSVTGLPNRAVINHVLDLASRNGPNDCRGSMFFIDLDGFKRVNDTFGHDAGDELLRLVSHRIVEEGFGMLRGDLETCTTAFGELCTACPSNLVFARFAGDEFVGLLPGVHDDAHLNAVAANILACLEAPFTVFEHEIHMGASIGIARLEADMHDTRQLLIHADIAMYRAKENGRNCTALFDNDLKTKVAERVRLEEDLRTALAADELHLEFQPKICAKTHHLMGLEALARWNHPELGYIPPDRFVPIAEQAGSMVQLGETVLRLAVAQGSVWDRAGAPLTIAVNVSAVQFASQDLARTILSILDRAKLDPKLFELEITESLAMADYASTKRRLDSLRFEGMRIAIDDFGTGYSNLSQLARLDFDMLKIDRSLVGGIGQNGKSEAMLRATIDLAHALGHQVVAEGIETMSQMAFLEQFGCDQYQGFLIAKPMSPDSVMPWNSARTDKSIAAMQSSAAKRIQIA